ncbi:DNase I-like protein [Myriangium duriaei CBS 260.36]|uniref:DNA-(apurinic or apyrimidinic site) endonuclease 2 n=1 Tax=Myriangium duriaei CBS 260.36 TaxID=1168546 RepID=A0A9P4IXW5_9PEZI|nr:DNase I-like protein [Myriangium duriaei CBS 260.36]
MRITTWNVNGIRNPFGYAPWNVDRTFPAMFDILQSDIIVMQELKIQRKDLRDDMVLLDGWDCYFSLPKHKKGYSGVGIYTRNETCSPIKAEEGLLGVLKPPGSTLMYRELPEDQAIGGYPTEVQIADLDVNPIELDSEGRCVCLEFPAFVLFGVYSPANSTGLRDDFRYGFLCALDCRIRNLARTGKRIILVGDLNVSRSELDTANALEDIRKAGMTHDEYISTPNRRVFNHLIVGGEVIGTRDLGREEAIMSDLVRSFHPTRKGMYTHWETKTNARPGNFGSRIDFVLVSQEMEDWFLDANIQEGLMGSDHCPVYGEFKDVVAVKSRDGNTANTHILDMLNPPGQFKGGTRLKDWSVKDIPPFSGRLLPEFDKRRSIKDMFKKPGMPKSTSISQAALGESREDSALPSNGSALGIPSPEKMPHTSFDAVTDDVQSQPSPTKSSTSTSPLTKRKASITTIPSLGKKQKSNSQSQTQKSDAQKGQQSLKGFFAPKSTTSSVKPVQDTEPASPKNGTQPLAANTSIIPSSPRPSSDLSAAPITSPTRSTPGDPPSPTPSSDFLVHDPIVAKQSWDQLMKKPAAPLCESHNEPCKVMLTKKKGENQGRSFWMCARPLGPSGAKERGTQWRCGTFVWCSDIRGQSG